MNSACPPLEELRRLGADSLDSGALHRLEAHVHACAGCRDLLERLVRLDTTATAAGPAAEPATPPKVPGCILGKELGRGGSGVVYEALQPTLGRRVAVKVLAVGPAADSDARRRWLREARAIARVPHPNIVRLHDAGEHEGRLFLVLDLVPGGSLRDRAAGRPIPPRDAARVVETVARAVEKSHRAGILHLDVKPSNILMDGPDGADWARLTPMLSDFGIARDEGDSDREALLTGTLGARGTPAFMAPEQVAGRPAEIGPTADVYALGATLYSLLTGRPPFLASSPIETMDLLRTADPAPPRALAPGVPRDLETICLKALEKAPARRYPSAAALAEDLSRFREGRPIQARPISVVGRLARWGRRRPVSAALTAALLTTILVALVALTTLWRRSEAALARAVRGEAAAEGAVADLLALVRSSIDAPERFASQRTSEAMAAVLDLTARLRETPGLAARHAFAVADIESDLARWRDRGGDRAGAFQLLGDADRLLSVASDRDASGGGRALADARRAEVILHRVAIGIDGQQFDAAAADLRLARSVLRGYPNDPRTLAARADLHFYERALHRRRPDIIGPPAPVDDPVLLLVDALERSLAEWHAPGLRAEAWAAYKRLPAGLSLPRNVAGNMQDMAAKELSSIGEADVGDAGQFDAEATARRLAAALDAQAACLGAMPNVLDNLVERLSQYGALQTIAARRAGRHDEARRVIAWSAALGKSLARRLPRSAGPHLMIGRALEQEAKLAWGPPADEAAVERALRAALDEVALAQILEPDREEARRDLAGLREKYLRLLAREPDPRAPAPDVQIPLRPAS